MADTREDFVWSDPAAPGYDLHLGTMFAGLVHHLALRCAGAQEWARCQSCGDRIAITQPLRDRRTFWCSEDECKKAQNQAKNLSWRDRNRERERERERAKAGCQWREERRKT
jgi:hypothetical protein